MNLTALLVVSLIAPAAAQDPGPAGIDPATRADHMQSNQALGARVNRLGQRLDRTWVLMGQTGSDTDRIHRWWRIDKMVTVQAREFETAEEAAAHVKALVATLSVPVDERPKAGSFAARIGWGDGGSSVYMSVGRTALVISAPTTDLARRLLQQAAREFADEPPQRKSARR